MSKSHYSYYILAGALIILDECNKLGGMSVTNNMENVLAEIEKEVGQMPKIIIYRDTEGVYDKTWLDKSGIAQFKSLGNCREVSDAIQIALQSNVQNSISISESQTEIDYVTKLKIIINNTLYALGFEKIKSISDERHEKIDYIVATAALGVFSPEGYPLIGELCNMSGANMDAGDDWVYTLVRVVGYSRDGLFICTAKDGCWPTVEKLSNCKFKPNEEK